MGQKEGLNEATINKAVCKAAPHNECKKTETKKAPLRSRFQRLISGFEFEVVSWIICYIASIVFLLLPYLLKNVSAVPWETVFKSSEVPILVFSCIAPMVFSAYTKKDAVLFVLSSIIGVITLLDYCSLVLQPSGKGMFAIIPLPWNIFLLVAGFLLGLRQIIYKGKGE